MKKTSGHLFKRGKYYSLVYTHQGEKKTVSLHVTTMVEAEKERERLLKPLLEIKTVNEMVHHIANAKRLSMFVPLSLDESYNDFLKSRSNQSSKNKIRAARREKYWKEFVEYCKSRGLNMVSDITEIIIHDFLTIIDNRNVSANTYNAIMLIIKGIYLDIARRYKMDLTLFENVREKKDDTISRKELTIDQLEKLFEHMESPTCNIRHKDQMIVLVHIGAYTGLRLKDCCLLKWVDVCMTDKKYIMTKNNKTQRDVIIPIIPRLLEKIELAKTWKDDSGFVLPLIAVRYERAKDKISKSVIKCLEAIGLENDKDISNLKRQRAPSIYGFHSLRHTFVSLAASAGVPMTVVQAIVGHANQDMTRHYTHLGLDTLINGMNKLDDKIINDENESGFIKIEKIKLKALVDCKKELMKWNQIKNILINYLEDDKRGSLGDIEKKLMVGMLLGYNETEMNSIIDEDR